MIKNNKVKLIISSVIILLPILIGIIFWNELPDTFATHWGSNGEADGFSGKTFGVFGLPVILLGLFWLCVIITAKDPQNKDQDRKAVGMVLWIIPLLSCVVNGMVYLTAFGKEFDASTVVAVIIGIMFLWLGNYLPKCRQNSTIGIKIRWTLQSEENWNATHRFTGKVWVISGVVIMIAALLSENIFAYVLLCILIPVAVIPLVYSYRYYKKEVKAGAEFTPMVKSKYQKNMAIVSICLVVILLIFTAVMMFTGDIKVIYNNDSFTVNTNYYSDITVEYSSIDNIEYREEVNFGTRKNGFGSARLLMGIFQNKEFGDYTLYAYVESETCVILTVDQKILVIGGETADSTKDIYENLLSRTKN